RRQVDEPGNRGEALRVERLVGLEAVGRLVERGDLAVHDEDRTDLVPIARRVDDAGARDLEPGSLSLVPHADPSMLITAMRTAMPNVTCGMITLCGPSATDESISTPRFMGPGCITMASRLASASFSAVRP